MSLTAKQEQFCKEYLIDLNATQAAIRAGYSKNCADVIGCENLAKPSIQERLAELTAERNERVQVDADWVLQEAVSAFGHLRDNDDFTTAKGYLEMAGKHVNVGAFKERLEIGGSSELMELLTSAATGHSLPKGEL